MRRKLLHKHVPPYFHFWNVRGCTLPKSAGAGLISNHANRPEKRQWGHGGRVGTGWALMAFSRAFAPPHPNHAVQHQPGPRHPHVGSKAWCHHGDIQNRLWASSLLYISEQRISSSFLLSLLWTEDRPNLVALASFCSKVLKGVFVAAPWLSWRWVISWGGGFIVGGPPECRAQTQCIGWTGFRQFTGYGEGTRGRAIYTTLWWEEPSPLAGSSQATSSGMLCYLTCFSCAGGRGGSCNCGGGGGRRFSFLCFCLHISTFLL